MRQLQRGDESLGISTVTRLRYQHESLPLLIADQDPARRPAPEKWSILENIAHLGAYQKIFAARIQRILSEENPLIPAYVGDADPCFLQLRENSIQDLIVYLNSDRLYLHDWLTSLSGEQLSRRATHPRYGDRTLLLWTEFFLLHESHHLETIWKLRT
jgi:hypothetical protein